jgi:hypothetical protein
MKHKVVEIGDNQIYVINIPEYPEEGKLSTQDRVILRLANKLTATNEYINDMGIAPYKGLLELNVGKVERMRMHSNGYVEFIKLKND